MPEENLKNQPVDKDVELFKSALAYARVAKLTLEDLKSNRKDSIFFSKYSKESIEKWLKTPSQNIDSLREASNYLYNASSHYARLINYFGKMPLYAYTIIPYNFDVNKVKLDLFAKKYRETANKLDSMNLKHEFVKIGMTCFREDIFYGYEYATDDSYFIKKLPSKFCKVSSIEDGVFNFAFDFSYFKTHQDKLATWGNEFVQKYKAYEKDTKLRWQELDSKKTACFKLNEDVEYPIPPFIGIFGALYDLEDYKLLTKASEEMANYKMLSLKIPLNDDGTYQFEEGKAMTYYKMLNSVVPENIGTFVTPMDLDEHSFERSGTASQSNSVADAESQLWNAAGVSQLLFNSEKSSSATIGNSIKTDEEYVFALLTQMERWVNRKLKFIGGTYKFKVNMLHLTLCNQKEMLEQYIKAGQVGAPVKMAITACLGYTPSEITNMCFLENEVLKLHENYVVLSSSHTQSGSDSSNAGGRPLSDDDDLSEEGIKSRDDNRKTE